MRGRVGFLAGLCGFLVAGCDRGPRGSAEQGAHGPALQAWVSIAPQAFFVRRIGGNHVRVETLLAPGQSPATFDPTPKQLVRLAKADVYFRIGVPFEQALIGKLASVTQRVSIIDTRKGVALREMDRGHDHNHDGSAGAFDPHIWLDPALVKIQSRTICEALCESDPARADTYRRNLATFESELEAVADLIRRRLAPIQGRRFYVIHPAYGYFADAFGLAQVAVEVSGKAPSAKKLGRLIDRMRRDGVRTIFVQPQFGMGSAQAIAQAIGGQVVPLDPMAGDYLVNLDDIAKKVRMALLDDSQRSLAATRPQPSAGEHHE